MKHVLLLQSRPEDEVAEDEYRSIINAGIHPDRVQRIRMEREDIPHTDSRHYDAIIVGGGPSNVSDSAHTQPEHQRRYEPQLFELMSDVVAHDTPFLGICYGLGILAAHQGGTVSHKHAEGVGAVDIVKTTHGIHDHLTRDMPDSFKAYVGHKEAVEIAPQHVTILASSESCPYQLVRVGNNVYGTQFHPELNAESLALRINAYKHRGYFAPEEADSLIAEGYRHDVSLSNQLLRRFVDHYINA